MKTIAIILAAGSGRRLGSDLPKQFLEVEGRQVIEYTLEAFEKCAAVDEICVVTHQHHIPEIKSIAIRNGFHKLRNVITGGADRFSSSLAALEFYANESPETIIMFHDSVRPLIAPLTIEECVKEMESHDAVALGTPSTDTIWVLDSQTNIREIPPRGNLYNAQTPQCFRLGQISEAYSRAASDSGFVATDDCGVLLRYAPECKIHVVKGSADNLKITYKEDLSLLATLLKSRSQAYDKQDESILSNKI